MLLWAALSILAAAAAGCDERVVINAAGAEHGLVILLPGIDGRSGYSEAACRALCRDGFDEMSVELRDWTSPLGAFFNQTAEGRNRAVAASIAERIVEYHREFPGRPVFLVGHSGGTAIAVWTAEALPDDEQVEGLVLLASSLSPGYDLSTALARTRGGIVSFNSPHDMALLGAGTTILGTMDGRHCPSAGMAGFEVLDRPGYQKLFQIAWDSAMTEHDNGGDHFGCMAERFVGAYVKPLVRSEGWSEGLIASVSSGKGESYMQDAINLPDYTILAFPSGRDPLQYKIEDILFGMGCLNEERASLSLR
jgi:pimeloyl-ACP methyl ester carboxylesterase